MPIKSAPYYWVECDSCGTWLEDDEGAQPVFHTVEQLAERAPVYDWSRDGDRWYCPDCTPCSVAGCETPVYMGGLCVSCRQKANAEKRGQ